jgi:putative ABC transport system ATP-binding protein
MQIIEVRNVSKDYDTDGKTVPALRGVDLTIDTGEFTALAGPSGSGKTTLLNLIGGLDSPTAGSITVENTRLQDLTPKKLADLRLRRIGFVFQAYNLIPVLTAFENVEYVLLLQGVEKKQRTKRAEDVLNDVGLEEEMHRPPHELSGGQQQRVAVARAVVSEPSIVLADEPTANLDQNTGARLLDMMRSLNESKGITFLFSTHDPMVMERSQRLINLVDGQIV